MFDAIARRLGGVLVLGAVVALALPVGALAGKGSGGSSSFDAFTSTLDTALTASCGYSTSDVFAAWGDTAQYSLVPGGDVEAKKHGWKLSGSASVVASKSLLGSGRRAIGLGPGGQATTQSFCVTLDSPTTRFVVDAPADPTATLRVDVVSPCSTGSCSMPIGWVYGGDPGLRPVSPMLLFANLTALLSPDGLATAQLRFTAERGSWKVDDVYVDPFRRV